MDHEGYGHSDRTASTSDIHSGVQDLKAAMAVVLHINSPGGSPVQAGIINDEIKRLKLLDLEFANDALSDGRSGDREEVKAVRAEKVAETEAATEVRALFQILVRN